MRCGKRRARRREGAGAKAPECAIAAGRLVGGQTRCLVSVLTKRAINSMKTGRFILNSQIYAQRVPTDADPQMRRNLNARVPRAQGALAQRTQRITGSAFRISFNLYWLMDNDIFNRPIMARTQTPGTLVVIQNKD